MEFKYSTVIDPLTYQTLGLCDSIPVRVHQEQEHEDYGAIKAQEHWNDRVAPLGLVKASLGPRFNFLSAAFPEMLPDRVEILAYFNEYIFLHDDVVEAVDKVQGDELNDLAMQVCRNEHDPFLSKPSRRKLGTKWMMSYVARRVMEIDPRAGAEALALWVEWFEKGAGRLNHTPFDNLEDYLQYRVMDVGEMYLTGVAIFAMNIFIPPREHELRSRLCRAAWEALGLTNDLYSFDKERRAAQATEESHISNAIWVLMQQYSIAEEEAKQLCQQKIREKVAEFRSNVTVNAARTDVSQGLRLFVEAVQYIISGNVVWTLDAPRYNPEATFNPQQLKWMTQGVPTLSRREAMPTSDPKALDAGRSCGQDSESRITAGNMTQHIFNVSALKATHCGRREEILASSI